MRISKVKSQYSQSLHNLEEISESIHIRRKVRQLWAHKIPPWTQREPGVGAELDYDLDECDRGSTRSSLRWVKVWLTEWSINSSSLLSSSGQSSDMTSSDRDSIENLPRESEFELHSKFGTLSLAQRSMAPVSRTTSCPAKVSSKSKVKKFFKKLNGHKSKKTKLEKQPWEPQSTTRIPHTFWPAFQSQRAGQALQQLFLLKWQSHSRKSNYLQILIIIYCSNLAILHLWFAY